MSSDNPVWLSAHLFYRGNLHLLLKKLVLPFLQEWEQSPALQRYFFIRYGEGGKHIRLRLQLLPQWENAAKEKLEAIAATFFKEHPALENSTSVPGQSAVETEGVRYVVYQPEYNRYGGEEVMRGAEIQFGASAAFVVAQLADSENWSAQQRFLFAIKMHLAFWIAQGFTKAQIKVICERFIDEWLPVLYVPGNPARQERSRYLHLFHEKIQAMNPSLLATINECHAAFSSHAFDDESMAQFFEQNKEVYSHYAHFSFSVYAGICISFMHMTHNRLGIANGDEAWLVYLLQYGLSYE